jgi:hypothetical protein
VGYEDLEADECGSEDEVRGHDRECPSPTMNTTVPMVPMGEYEGV